MYKSRKIYRFLWHNQPLRHLLRRLLHTFSLSLCVHPFLSSSIVLNISPPHSPNTRRIFVLSRGVVGWYGYDGSVCSVSQFSCQQRWGRTNQRCPVCVLHRTQLLLLFAGYFCCRFRIARRSFSPLPPTRCHFEMRSLGNFTGSGRVVEVEVYADGGRGEEMGQLNLSIRYSRLLHTRPRKHPPLVAS